MNFKGTRIQYLREMQPGKLYVFLNDELKDGEIQENPYPFVFVTKKVHPPAVLNNRSVIHEITYFCEVINAPEGQTDFRLFETIDQIALDDNNAALYVLEEQL